MNKQSDEMDLIYSVDGTRTITVAEFDRLFDEGSDEIDQFLDRSRIKTADEYTKRVNVDMPVWMILRLDDAARHRGVSRQAVIKMWLAERLEAK
jgi:hypothetical protein